MNTKQELANQYAIGEYQGADDIICETSKAGAIADCEEDFMAGWDAAMKERDEEMIKFTEWLSQLNPGFSCANSSLSIGGDEHKNMPSLTQFLEKFRSLPPSPPKE